MKVLVACEYSDTVSAAFRKRGHDVTSCDLALARAIGSTSKATLAPLLREPWDLVIAHPPCNRLSNLNYFAIGRNPHFWKEFEGDSVFHAMPLCERSCCLRLRIPAHLPKARAILAGSHRI